MPTDEREELKTRVALVEARLEALETTIKTYGKIILAAALFGSPIAAQFLGLLK